MATNYIYFNFTYIVDFNHWINYCSKSTRLPYWLCWNCDRLFGLQCGPSPHNGSAEGIGHITKCCVNIINFVKKCCYCYYSTINNWILTHKNEKRTSLNFTFWQLVTTLSLDPGITDVDLVRKQRRQKEQINKGNWAALVRPAVITFAETKFVILWSQCDVRYIFSSYFRFKVILSPRCQERKKGFQLWMQL